MQKVDVNRVVFESIEEYENLFEDPKTTGKKASEVAARFSTFNEATVDSALEDTLYPEFLQKILNDDHVVQIDKWLIKVDAEKEQVLVLDKKYLDQYTDLANSNLDNKNILVYSTEDQVLSMLKSNSKPSATRVSCSGDGAGPDDGDRDQTYGKNLRVRIQTHYRRYGIYFELCANPSKQKKRLGIWSYTSGNLRVEYSFKYQKLCSGEVFPSYAGNYTGTSYGNSTFSAYSGSERLEKYFIEARTVEQSDNVASPYTFSRYGGF